jgi:hypothetical protein
MEEKEKLEIMHKYGNEVFGVQLIIKNLEHIVNVSQCSDQEKATIQKLLHTLLTKVSRMQELKDQALS